MESRRSRYAAAAAAQQHPSPSQPAFVVVPLSLARNHLKPQLPQARRPVAVLRLDPAAAAIPCRKRRPRASRTGSSTGRPLRSGVTAESCGGGGDSLNVDPSSRIVCSSRIPCSSRILFLVKIVDVQAGTRSRYAILPPHQAR